MEAYLDNSATTRCSERAKNKMVQILTEDYGNPSSLHNMGKTAEDYIKEAKEQIAKTLRCDEKEIIFTSGGTESNNMALIGGALANKRQGKHIITTSIEHASVQAPLAYLKELGYEITELSVDHDGIISLEELRDAVREDTVLVSIMMVNNEIGAVEPVEEAAKVIKAKNPDTLFHVDAIQAYGKFRICPKKMGIDLLSVSGHKIHAPKGIGALYIRSGLKLPPYILGGGQERGMRAGTEATPQIAAFGTAAEIGSAKMAQATKTMAELRAHAIDRLTAEVDGLVVIGGGSPHILSISLPGYRSEVLMNFLEARGIYTSKSSACKKGGRSHVLEAIGLPANVIDGALRISFSRYTTREDIDALCDALRDAKQSLFPSLH
mgnify:CR=1 FL=1